MKNMNKKTLYVVIATFALTILSCGCSKEVAEGDALFSLEEAVACLTDEDRSAIDAMCEKGVKTDDQAAEAIEKLKEYYANTVNEGDPSVEKRRRAAITWKIAEISYDHFNGTCAVQVMFAARAGLIEAQMMMNDPPRGLTTYLLPPGDPRRIEDE